MADEARGWTFAEPAPSAWRHLPVVVGVVLAHLAAGWALMRVDAVRAAVREAAPLFVEFIAAAPPPPPALPPPPPPPKRIAPSPKTRPIIAAPPAPSAAPAVFEVPPPPPPAPSEPPPEIVAIEPPHAPPPAPAPQPKTVPATAVQYLDPPAPVYPSLSRRVGEAGRVLVRVLIDVQGLPRQLALQQSSGFARLDDSAFAAIRAARFRPYSENGVAQPVWVLVPIVFALEG